MPQGKRWLFLHAQDAPCGTGSCTPGPEMPGVWICLNHIREFREKAGTTRSYWNGRDVIAKLHPLARRLEITEHHRTSFFQYVEAQRYLLLSPAFQVWCSIIAFLNVLFWSWFIVFESWAALPSADEIDGPPPLLCGIGDWFRDSKNNLPSGSQISPSWYLNTTVSLQSSWRIWRGSCEDVVEKKGCGSVQKLLPMWWQKNGSNNVPKFWVPIFGRPQITAMKPTCQ